MVNKAKYWYETKELYRKIRQDSSFDIELFTILEKSALKILLDLVGVVKAIVTNAEKKEIARTLNLVLLSGENCTERINVRKFVKHKLKFPPDGWELLTFKKDRVVVRKNRKKT